MNRNKQLLINMFASFVSFGVTFGINIILSPFIVSKLGVEAYGFVQLTNNILAYFSVLTIALNSMSSRFISISYFQDKKENASEYYSSTFFSNVILSCIILPVIIVFIIFLEKMINISADIVGDVKFLMVFLAVDFVLNLLATNLGIGYYIKNKLYINSIINIFICIFRAVLLLILFTCFKPFVAYLGAVTLLLTMVNQIINIYYKNKFLPDLKIKISAFRKDKTIELISSGIWNSITRVGSLLSEGLDLMITNIFISAVDMGVLAIAKMIPNMITSILNTMIATFMPNMTELYATNQKQEFVRYVKQSMKIIGMIISIPISLLVAFGDVVFEIWFPTQNSELLHVLAVLTILPWAIMGPASIIHNIFTVINKIKVNSILVCVTGLLNVLIVFVLLQITDKGLFIVAGVSAVLSILRNAFYTLPYGAKYIGQKWHIFYGGIIKSIISVCIVSGVGVELKNMCHVHGFMDLIVFGGVVALFGVLFNCFIIFNREDREFLKGIWQRKVLRRN